MQVMVTRMEEEKATASDKKCVNIASLLAYLYCFSTVSCVIVYDLIRLNIQSLNEIDVEILLRILKSICYLFSVRAQAAF